MEFNFHILQMAGNAQRIRALVENVSDEQARWKPAPDSWSILEVINHMTDVEQEDFRVLFDLAVNRPGDPRPKISPRAWATERKYNDRDLEQSLRNYLAAREKSLAWLRSLPAPNWEAAYQAPWGPIKTGDIFAAWIAHDILHMRQLAKLHYLYTLHLVEPYCADYAGDW